MEFVVREFLKRSIRDYDKLYIYRIYRRIRVYMQSGYVIHDTLHMMLSVDFVDIDRTAIFVLIIKYLYIYIYSRSSEVAFSDKAIDSNKFKMPFTTKLVGI